MKDYPETARFNRVIDEIIAVLPLDERVYIARLDKERFKTMHRAFELYIRNTVRTGFENRDYSGIMTQLWKRLRETHRLRIVK